MRTVEKRKADEIEHYDEKARRWRSDPSRDKWQTDVHGVRHDTFSSYEFLGRWLSANCAGKKLLDYGCGTGLHVIHPAACGAEVTGIDLSEDSLDIARERVRRAGVERNVSFLQMDCENLQFPPRSFDLILNAGTFSSIDLDRALPELARVLKPTGHLVGIETLGHNPMTNFKRRLNVLRGVRTSWAAGHIFRVEDLERAGRHFGRIDANYFHFLSLFLIPLSGLPGGRFLVKLADRLDAALLRYRFLRKYAFKVVFVLSEPRQA